MVVAGSVLMATSDVTINRGGGGWRRLAEAAAGRRGRISGPRTRMP